MRVFAIRYDLVKVIKLAEKIGFIQRFKSRLFLETYFFEKTSNQTETRLFLALFKTRREEYVRIVAVGVL